MKKLIALLLAAALCLGCFVLPAAAGEAEWRLSNAEQKVRVLLDEAGETAVTTDTASAPSTAYLDD